LLRIDGVNVFRIWSSPTFVVTWLAGIVPPSGSTGAEFVPGVISRYTSSSSDFSRTVMCASRWIGAYWSSIWITTRVRGPSRLTPTTLPTLTPAIRTSPWLWIESDSGSSTLNR
jgi:hypothetical protein